MEITNELKAIEEVYAAIKRGYGFEQMKAKLNLTDGEIASLGAKHPDFLNEVNKRYKKNFGKDAVQEKKEVKTEKKQEFKGEVEPIRENAKRLGIKHWHNKSEKKLLEEIALIEAND